MNELKYCNVCFNHIGKEIKAWGRIFKPCKCKEVEE